MDSSDTTQGDRPLAVAIAIATRSSHTRLNKSIIARLPLVVNAPDPSAYVTGMLHVAPIYLTFETLWKHLLDYAAPDNTWLKLNRDANPTPCETGSQSATDETKSQLSERMRTILQKLYLPELMRSNRLRQDIRAMTGWSQQVVEEQLQETAQSGRLGEFTSHIRRSIEHRPHVLIAYSYILFMALFAGGRYMRATFESAGDAFWEQTPSMVKPNGLTCEHRDSLNEEPASLLSDFELQYSKGGHAEHRLPLRFFHFATLSDGEDLKRQFKDSLLEAENDLSHQEKHDIVQEAVCIFDNMELLVTQLDQVCAAMEPEAEDVSPLTKKMATRARDSVFVHRARAARSSKMSSESDSTSDTPTESTDNDGHSSAKNSVPNSIRGESDGRTNTVDMRNFGPGHPPVAITPETIELCPAMKSMRFDRNLAARTRTTLAEEKAKGFGNDLNINWNWALMATIGALVVGGMAAARRGILSA